MTQIQNALIQEAANNVKLTKFKTLSAIPKIIAIIALVGTFSLGNNQAYAALNDVGVDIDASALVNQGAGNNIDFSGDVILTVDGDVIQDDVTAGTDDFGEILFNDIALYTFTVSGNVGALGAEVNSITFATTAHEDSEFILGGNIDLNTGITTEADGKGKLTLNGTGDQSITTSIGANNLALKAVTVANTGGTATFDGVTLYTKAFDVTDGDVSLNVAANALGAVTIAAGSIVTVVDSIVTDSLDIAGTLDLDAGQEVSVTGNVTGSGSITGSGGGAGGQGILTLNGTTANQTISIATIGDSTDNLALITVNNTSLDGTVTFSGTGDIYTAAFTVTDGITNIANTGTVQLGVVTIADAKTLNLQTDASMGAAAITGTLTIASGKTATIAGLVTADGDIIGVTNGVGSVIFGIGADTIAANVGTEANTLASVTVSNANATLFDGNDTTLNTLAFTIDDAADAVTIAATPHLDGVNLGAVTFAGAANANVLVLEEDTGIDSIAFNNANDIMTIDVGKEITITGNITGNGTIAGVADDNGTVDLTGTTDQTISGSVGNAAGTINVIAINKTAGTTATFTGAGTIDSTNFNVNTGNVTINNTGVVSLGIVTVGNASTLEIAGAGAVDIASYDGTDTATLYVNGTDVTSVGAITVAATGTLKINVSGGQGSITAVGGSVLSTGSSFVVTGLTEGVGAVVFVDNAAITDGAGAHTSETITALLSGANNLFTLAATYDVVAPAAGVTVTSTRDTSTINAFGTNDASVVNSVLSTASTGVLGSIKIALRDEVATSAVAKAIKSIKKEANNSTAQGSVAIGGKAASTLSSRAADISIASNLGSSSGIATGNGGGELGVWIKGFGGTGEQDFREGEDGYDLQIVGFTVGADASVDFSTNFNSVMGVAFSHGIVDVKGTATNTQNTDITLNQVALYNINTFGEGSEGLYNENSINLGFYNYDTQRSVSVGSINGVADADYDGMEYGIKAGVGYNIKPAGNILVAPYVSLEYSSLDQDDYTESGTIGNAALVVQNESFDRFVSTIGAKVAARFAGNAYDFIPKLDLSWSRNISSDGQESNTSFISGDNIGKNTGIDLSDNIYNIGLGLTIVNKNDISLSFDYNLQKADEFIGHTGSIQYRLSF